MFLQVPAQATSLRVSTNSSLFYSSRANVYNYPMIEFHAHKAIIKSFCTHQLWFRSRHVLWFLFIFARLCTFGLSGLVLGNRSFSLIDLSPFALGTQHVLCRLSGIFMTRMAQCCRLCKACVRYANDICSALYIFSLRQTFALHQMLAASSRNMERENAYHTEFCVVPQKHCEGIRSSVYLQLCEHGKKNAHLLRTK